MTTFTAIHVEDSDTGSYWTLLELSTGQELRDAHKFSSQGEAEEMADILNGQISSPSGDSEA